jgi:hypothetical protein
LAKEAGVPVESLNLPQNILSRAIDDPAFRAEIVSELRTEQFRRGVLKDRSIDSAEAARRLGLSKVEASFNEPNVVAGSRRRRLSKNLNTPFSRQGTVPATPEALSRIEALPEGRPQALRDIAKNFGLPDDFFLQLETVKAARGIGAKGEGIFGERVFQEISEGRTPVFLRRAVEEVVAAREGTFGKLIEQRSPAAFSRSVQNLKDLDFAAAKVKKLREQFPGEPDEAFELQLDGITIAELKRAKKLAVGGAISGPGGPRSDRVPIMASNGEFIMNAAAVDRLGLPFMHALNSGNLPGFQDGGEVSVGPSSRGTTSFDVKVDTASISSAISNAITSAFDKVDFSLDTAGATNAIQDAITTALASIELPPIKVDTEGASVPLDIPAGGIPIDVTNFKGLDLGNNVGAAVRNRLEAVEGSVQGLREDANAVLDKLEGIDVEVLSSLPAEVESLRAQEEELGSKVALLEDSLQTQHDAIITEVFTMVNEQINNIQFGDDTASRVDRLSAETNSTFVEVKSRIAEAIDIANRALSQALARV